MLDIQYIHSIKSICNKIEYQLFGYWTGYLIYFFIFSYIDNYFKGNENNFY